MSPTSEFMAGSPLSPIRNPFELRGLCRRSYFGITNVSKLAGISIRGGLRDAPEYKLIGCIQDHHQLGTMQAGMCCHVIIYRAQKAI